MHKKCALVHEVVWFSPHSHTQFNCTHKDVRGWVGATFACRLFANHKKRWQMERTEFREKRSATPPHCTYTLEGVQVWKKGHWNKKRTVSILMNPLSTQLLVNPRVANVSCETAFYGNWFFFFKGEIGIVGRVRGKQSSSFVIVKLWMCVYM